MKLCKDCRFFSSEVYNKTTRADACAYPANRFLDQVHGEQIGRDPSWLRNLLDDDVCGPEGKWFEAKLK